MKEIFISPDGSLSLIPFEILRGPDGKFLIEDYTFNYLAAGRDILGFGQTAEKGGKSLIMGDPDFDMGSEEKAASLKTLALKTDGKAESLSRSSDMRGTNFKRLPHTKAEAEAVQSLLGKENSELYTDKAALEEVLLGKNAPKILHLATHGFFMKDTEIKGDIENEMMSMGMQPEISFFSQKGGLPKTFSPGMTGKFAQYQNPLLRSGIALAGANTALQSENPENSDGIVTAEKILGLKLRGTDMVVLSACETGLGDVKSGEGIYGLRRAFTQAGTKSLVMSMWAVPDKESMELMSGFYTNILSGKMKRNQSLREAVLKQMKTVNQRYGSPNPLFWGAFVFMGES